MHSVNIRQLKNNPSVALRAAKVAQVPLAEMLSRLSGMGIPLYGGSAADAVQEMETGAPWLAPKN